MTAEQQRLESIAVQMAAALRDKFDFSEDKNFADLADIAFKAANAIVSKSDEIQNGIELARKKAGITNEEASK
jgi:hypothetical protein